MVSSIDLITTRPGKTLEVWARATASLDQSGELNPDPPKLRLTGWIEA